MENSGIVIQPEHLLEVMTRVGIRLLRLTQQGLHVPLIKKPQTQQRIGLVPDKIIQSRKLAIHYGLPGLVVFRQRTQPLMLCFHLLAGLLQGAGRIIKLLTDLFLGALQVRYRLAKASLLLLQFGFDERKIRFEVGSVLVPIEIDNRPL
ncbi:hypothetical protein D3C86_1733850 [compost metagenome]